jgi:transcriptional regulator with GAF, ATPase, and Fis domain
VSLVDDPAVHRLTQEIDTLRRENEALLRELENSYAQLTAVLQVSQDETRIAYSELQEKLVVQEKKLVELSFLSSAGDALLDESELEPLCRLVVEKICLIVPIDLVLLHLHSDRRVAIQRERDLVRELTLERARQESLAGVAQTFEAERRAVWLVPDLDSEPGAAGLRMRPDARSAACLVLRSGGHDIGLLVLNSRLRANFRDDQEPLLEAFAHQAAAALASALRLAAHRDLVARLMAAHGIGPEALDRCARDPNVPAIPHVVRTAIHRWGAVAPLANTTPSESEEKR